MRSNLKDFDLITVLWQQLASYGDLALVTTIRVSLAATCSAIGLRAQSEKHSGLREANQSTMARNSKLLWPKASKYILEAVGRSGDS